MVKVIQINVGGFDNNFCYLIASENSVAPKGILIDPTGELKIVEKELEKNRVKLVMQLITHAHPDHCELIEHFKSKGIKLNYLEGRLQEYPDSEVGHKKDLK